VGRNGPQTFRPTLFEREWPHIRWFLLLHLALTDVCKEHRERLNGVANTGWKRKIRERSEIQRGGWGASVNRTEWRI
jgi:hypothetical protein